MTLAFQFVQTDMFTFHPPLHKFTLRGRDNRAFIRVNKWHPRHKLIDEAHGLD